MSNKFAFYYDNIYLNDIDSATIQTNIGNICILKNHEEIHGTGALLYTNNGNNTIQEYNKLGIFKFSNNILYFVNEIK